MAAGSKNPLLFIAAIVIFVIAVFIFVYPWKTEPAFPREKVVYGVCLETGKDMTMTVATDAVAPYLNKETGHNTVYGWWFCQDCGFRFVPPPSGMKPTETPTTQPVDGAQRGAHGTGIPTCPQCGSSRTGSWWPEDPTQKDPNGTAPLPALPGKTPAPTPELKPTAEQPAETPAAPAAETEQPTESD